MCPRSFLSPTDPPLQLEASFGIVVVKSITGYEFAGLFSRNIAGLFSDNHSQFHFPVHFLRAPGNHERIIWPHQRGCSFEEQHWLGRKLHAVFGRVIAIIESDTDDLARAADGRSQALLWAYTTQRGDVAIHQPLSQPCQTAASKKLLVIVGNKGRDIKPGLIVQQHARLLRPWFAKSNEFHVLSECLLRHIAVLPCVTGHNFRSNCLVLSGVYVPRIVWKAVRMASIL